MSRTNNHCPSCKEDNGAKGPFCPRCGWKYSNPVPAAENTIPDPKPENDTAPAAVNTNGGTNTMKMNSIILCILFILTVAAFIVFSPVLPFILGVWGIVAVVASLTLIVGLAAALIFSVLPDLLFLSWIRNLGITLGASFLALALIIGFALPLKGIVTSTTVPTESIDSTSAVINQTTAPTTIIIVPTGTVSASIGIDQPSKSWFLAKAGTLISGDVAIFDNDNNSKKTPVYDGKEGTADVIYLTQDTYIWAEWGCHAIENANAQDVANIINDKLTNGNFTSVRYFNGYTKLGTNIPVIFNSKVDASSITLPTITK